MLSNNLHSIAPAKTNDVPQVKTPNHRDTSYLVPRTARYPEKARAVDPRRERSKGRHSHGVICDYFQAS